MRSARAGLLSGTRRGATSGLPGLRSLLRFEPGSRFDAHSHPGGEEFLVLSGTFSDRSGDFTAGTYVRNPPGSRHAPWTEEGCVLFVKLCQFQVGDGERVIVDSRSCPWQASEVPGLERLELHRHCDERVMLLGLAAGAEGIALDCPRGGELLLLDGTLSVEDDAYAPGTWLRYPPGTSTHIGSAAGCRLYCRLGR